MQRRRFTQATSLDERLAEEARRLREQAKLLPPGWLREQAVRKARQMDVATHINEWLSSPGLRAPS